MSEAQSYQAGNIDKDRVVYLASDFDNVTRLFLDAAERCVASERREKELQQRLTAADERVDVLEADVARLNRAKLSLKELAESRADNCSVYRQHLTEALTMAEKVRDASPGMRRKCLSDLIVHLYQNSDAALKPAEGGDDEAMSFAQIAQFNDDNDHCPEREE